ncbi:MAG: TAXI family TRAP transporter solute-binding subunit, partial [Desulfovibrionaceae bacterium]|nr:TAXI family TRAP transporter solute-binding subunit [Desulfovibrionaceae bacterium]
MLKNALKTLGLMALALGFLAQPAQAKQRLLLGTSTGGGSYYVLGGTWSNALNAKIGDLVDISIEVTGGPETNIMLIENKEMELGLVTAWQADDMYNGKGKVPKKFQSIRSFIPLYPSYLQIYALASSGLTTLRDIEGKNACSSPAGSSSFLASRAIISTLGLKPGKISGMPASQQLNTLRDGQNQVSFSIMGVPAPVIMEMEATDDISMLTIKPEDFDVLLKAYPSWTKGVIPAGTYKSVKEDLDVVSLWNYAVVHKDISEDVVYAMTKATFESMEALAGAVKDMAK